MGQGQPPPHDARHPPSLSGTNNDRRPPRRHEHCHLCNGRCRLCPPQATPPRPHSAAAAGCRTQPLVDPPPAPPSNLRPPPPFSTIPARPATRRSRPRPATSAPAWDRPPPWPAARQPPRAVATPVLYHPTCRSPPALRLPTSTPTGRAVGNRHTRSDHHGCLVPAALTNRHHVGCPCHGPRSLLSQQSPRARPASL